MKQRRWLEQIRLRAVTVLVAFVLAGLGVAAWAALPAWPAVGVAVGVAAVVVNSMASRLSEPTCLGCGNDLGTGSESPYGLVCTSCGHVTPVGGDRSPDRLA